MSKNKCPYTDEQLSIIMSAKAGKQLVPGGAFECDDAVGCINQVAFYDQGLSIGEAINETYVGKDAKDVAFRFDSVNDVSKLSYEQLLRICRA